ncbi:MAG: TetR family transcriptional regulator [Blastocatellia bacterium]|nr:TetR family transcriptional regulator [Blastocatellia bacterium]
MTEKKMEEREDVVRVGTRMAAEDRRQQILDVAVRLFSKRGFRGTTTKEIALAAGVNEAIIYRHFATKSELYTAIIDQKASSSELKRFEETLVAAMERREDRKVFESFAQFMLDFHARDETAMRILLYSALEGHELADMIFRNHISKSYRILSDYLRKRISEGNFRKVDTMAAVRGYVGMVMHHAMINRFFQTDGKEMLNISNRQAAERFADLFLGSLMNLEFQKSK